MSKSVIAIIVIVIVAAGVGFLLTRGNGASQTTPPPADTGGNAVPEPGTPPPDSNGTPPPPTGQVPEVKSFTVTGKPFSFSPSTMTVNKGDTVKITFKNSGGTHDFVIDEFNARTPKIGSGQEETIQFTADKTGSFEYYCSVGTHRAMGMKGTLTVQ